jgi:predicted nucleic acid-binding protein
MTRYLLDTVAISELRRDARRMHPAFALWQQNVGDVWLSVITLNELRYGIRMVQRKDQPFAAILEQWYAQLIAQPQRFRILDVDRPIAELAADFRAAHDTPFEDSLIAATAKVHGLTLATRNTADFKDTGISLVNPWEHRS